VCLSEVVPLRVPVRLIRSLAAEAVQPVLRRLEMPVLVLEAATEDHSTSEVPRPRLGPHPAVCSKVPEATLGVDLAGPRVWYPKEHQGR
jgi:hypothetical protein